MDSPATAAAIEPAGIEEPTEIDAATKIEAPPVAPTVREVILKVPVTVPDAEIQFALNIGIAVNEAMKAGIAMLVFPMSKEINGQQQMVAGQMRVPLLNPMDIKRLGTLCETITKANLAVMDAVKSGQASNELTARVNGEKAKDNATRDLTAKAGGKAGGIIVAGGGR